MKRSRLSDSLALRLTVHERMSIESVAEQKDLAMAELARAYIREGLARDGIAC
jgi:hypothetical protein